MQLGWEVRVEASCAFREKGWQVALERAAAMSDASAVRDQRAVREVAEQHLIFRAPS